MLMSRVIVVGVLLCISQLSAEPQSAITGQVTDSQGAVIAKARVLVHWDPSGSTAGLTDNVGAAQDISVVTDDSGKYSAVVPSGFYDVFVTATGFTPTAVIGTARAGESGATDPARVDHLSRRWIRGKVIARSENPADCGANVGTQTVCYCACIDECSRGCALGASPARIVNGVIADLRLRADWTNREPNRENNCSSK